MTCPCGETKLHEVARRRSFDGKLVALWSDGGVATAMGFGIRGVGAPRSTYARNKALEAGWLVMAEVELRDFSEVPALVKAARRAVSQQFLPALEFLLRTMAGERFRFNGCIVDGRKAGATD